MNKHKMNKQIKSWTDTGRQTDSILRWCWEFSAKPTQQQAREGSQSLESHGRLTTSCCTQVSKRKHSCEAATATKGTATTALRESRLQELRCNLRGKNLIPLGWAGTHVLLCVAWTSLTWCVRFDFPLGSALGNHSPALQISIIYSAFILHECEGEFCT